MTADEARALAELMVQAKSAFDSLTPDEQIHHRHEQRISFVVGNVGLSAPERPRDQIEASVRKAAGPCACAGCRVVQEGPYR